MFLGVANSHRLLIKDLNGLLALIKTHLSNLEVPADDAGMIEGAEAVKIYYENTVKHITRKVNAEDGSDYSQIEI